MTTSPRPWREIAIPHEDVLKGTFQQGMFTLTKHHCHDII